MAANLNSVKQEDLSQEEEHLKQENQLKGNDPQQRNPQPRGFVCCFLPTKNGPFKNYPRGTSPVSWEVYKAHRLPSRFRPCIFRGEMISYAYLNTVRTWHWKSDEEELQFFPLERGDIITALAEVERPFRNGYTLIVGTEKGHIYAEASVFSSSKVEESTVIDITVLGIQHYIVKHKNGKNFVMRLYNITAWDFILSFDAGTEIYRFRENYYLEASGRDVEIHCVGTRPRAPNISFRLSAEFTDIRVVDERFVLFEHANGSKFTIWDTEENRSLKAPLNSQNQFRILDVIDLRTLLIPEYVERQGTRLDKYSHDGRRWNVQHGPFVGEVKLTSMVRVGNHIMYGSGSETPGIHVFSRKDCGRLFTDTKCTENGTRDPLELANLVDGFVGVRLTQGKICVMKKIREYKDRLFVGAGDFSFTEAFLRKHEATHPELPRHVTATELKTEVDDVTRCRVEELMRKGVVVFFGVDARKLSEFFPKRRFNSVHWNCPGVDDCSTDPHFAGVISEFFDSCKRLQDTGDRVHVTLIDKGSARTIGNLQDIVPTSAAFAGYRLVKKRKFGEDRYPGYSYASTLAATGQSLREFVFERAPPGKGRKVLSTKRHMVIDGTLGTDVEDGKPENYFFECSSDEDSSTLGDDNDGDNNEAGGGRGRSRSGIQGGLPPKRMRGEEADQPVSTPKPEQAGTGEDG